MSFSKMRNIIFICMVFSALSATAQGPQVDLPWMPTRDTNHIKTIRYYKYDTVTLERTLNYTENYDRHGYLTSPLTQLTYNDKGQLTRRVSLEKHSNVANPMGWIDTAEVWDIRYSPDGVIQQINAVFHESGLTTVYSFDLISHKSHPVYGLLDYSFNWCRTNGEDVFCDTIYYHREFDDNGHLRRESRRYDDMSEEITYSYRADGRILNRVGYYYESRDSLSYHYDANGVLTHMTGKLYDLGMEADVFIRCQPDGRKIEERQVWHIYEDDSEFTEIYEFDSHGLLLRSRIEGSKTPYYDCEIDYWE